MTQQAQSSSVISTPDAAKQEGISYRSSHSIPPKHRCLSSHTLQVLHCTPEVIRIEMPRELGIDIDNMHVALGRIPNHSLVVLARRLIRLDIDAQRAIQLELESTPHD